MFQIFKDLVLYIVRECLFLATIFAICCTQKETTIFVYYSYKWIENFEETKT